MRFIIGLLMYFSLIGCVNSEQDPKEYSYYYQDLVNFLTNGENEKYSAEDLISKIDDNFHLLYTKQAESQSMEECKFWYAYHNVVLLKDGRLELNQVTNAVERLNGNLPLPLGAYCYPPIKENGPQRLENE